MYVSALETAASAMEIGAIAGKNAALLLAEHLAGASRGLGLGDNTSARARTGETYEVP